MGRNRQNRKDRSAGRSSSSPSPAEASPQPSERMHADRLAVLREEASALSTGEAPESRPPAPLAPADEPSTASPPEGVDLAECVRMAEQARRDFESAAKKSNAARVEAERLQAEIGEALKKARRDEATLATRTDEAQRREAALAEREAKLEEREADARAGFAARNREAMARLHEEIGIAEQELGALRAHATRERAALRNDLAGLHAQADARLETEASAVLARLAEERAEVSAARAELRAERTRLEAERDEVELERELLAGERAAVSERVARLSATEVDEARAAAAAAQSQLARARAERDRLQGLLDAREEADLRFGHRTPEETLDELRHYRAECERLRSELALRPGREMEERCALLERESHESEQERMHLRHDNARLQRELGRHLIAVTELETLRDQKRLLEARCSLLRAESERLESLITSLTENGKAPHVFPALHAIDDDPRSQDEPELADGELDLRRFVADLGQRIATDPQRAAEGLDPLYYSARTLRALLGGLAMSRLHILQGISGTGKTSLPLAFARAVGGGHRLVEVQAGWRDRDDLLGHFNAFEGRYHEREFLKALYEAQSPAHREGIYVVVLDEMNLSHPEHYFADLLSALELNPAAQRLGLLAAPVPRVPRHLADGGTALMIPRNVWIVGTANHDETTREFADKTYDRAHVMELPARHERFSVEPPPPRHPVSHAALERAFGRAVDETGKEAAEVCDLVRKELGDVLAARFQIGWGNRFERQTRRFYPVVIAAGGTAGEAVDHMVANKLLRKLRDRHASLPEDLRQLRHAVEALGARLDRDCALEQSLKIIGEELRRHRDGAVDHEGLSE